MTLRLERDKTYLTRGGELVVIDCLNTGHKFFPVLAHDVEDGDPFLYTRQGRMHLDCVSDMDIVAEYMPPVTHERDVVFYRYKDGSFFGEIFVVMLFDGQDIHSDKEELHRQRVTYVHTQKT